MEEKFKYNEDPIIDESVNTDLIDTKDQDDEPVNPNEV